MGELTFYPITVVASLVKQRRGYGAETVNSHVLCRTPSATPRMSGCLCTFLFGSEKQKRPKSLFFNGFWPSWPLTDQQMVEAGGIEPPSENIPHEASTGLGQVCISPRCWPLTRRNAAISPVNSSRKTPARAGFRQPDTCRQSELSGMALTGATVKRSLPRCY